MKNIKLIVFIISLLLVLFLTASGFANGSDDYLVSQDIGEYIFRPKRVITIGNAGVLVPTGHFSGHGDMTYEGIYIHPQTYMGVVVKVTQHAGSDSDKWLLHEVEDGYRSDKTLNETTDTNVQMRLIDGNNLYFIGIYGGKSYTWIANNSIVVDISCSSCPNTKPEPLEIVNAYLTKYPSAISLTDGELRSTAHAETWIKDEMDRRLWLGGKWMGQINTAGDLDKLSDVVKNLNVFLDYREKYYGIEVGAEKNVLFTAQQSKDKATIEAKLNDYYKWWNENKDKPINL